MSWISLIVGYLFCSVKIENILLVKKGCLSWKNVSYIAAKTIFKAIRKMKNKIDFFTLRVTRIRAKMDSLQEHVNNNVSFIQTVVIKSRRFN